jgi:hypothetical protein
MERITDIDDRLLRLGSGKYLGFDGHNNTRTEVPITMSLARTSRTQEKS